MNWRTLFGYRLLAAVLAILVIAALSVTFRDPFDFDDRPHIERLMKLALSTAQADTTVDFEERMWAQVKLAEAGDLSSMSAHDWEVMSKSFLAHNPGYVGLQLLDRTYRVKRTVALSEAASFDATVDFLADARLQHTLQTAAAATNRVAAVPIELPKGRPGYLIAVPNFARGELVGFLVVECDVEKTLDSMLSEFKQLGYSVAISDNFRQLYQTPGSGSSETRKEWGQSAKVPLPPLDWRVEVWPKPELVAEARSPLPELGVLFALALLVLLASAIHLARQLHSKSVLLRGARDELELRVQERTAELQAINKELEAEIHERRQAEKSLQELSGRLLRLRDEEQRRIGRELHDSTAQILGALAINLERVQQLVLSGEISKLQKLLAQSTDLAEQATIEVRTLSYLLHPPLLDELGLEGVLPWYAAGFSSRCGIQVNVVLQPNLGRFSSETELTLFRVVQEALTNIHLHSGSPTADITVLKDANRVQLWVTDHGRGIPPGTLGKDRNARAFIGVGIAGMQERIRQLEGVLEIESGDSGTRITVMLPIRDAKLVSEHDSNQGNTELTDTTKENPIAGEQNNLW